MGIMLFSFGYCSFTVCVYVGIQLLVVLLCGYDDVQLLVILVGGYVAVQLLGML